MSTAMQFREVYFALKPIGVIGQTDMYYQIRLFYVPELWIYFLSEETFRYPTVVGKEEVALPLPLQLRLWKMVGEGEPMEIAVKKTENVEKRRLRSLRRKLEKLNL